MTILAYMYFMPMMIRKSTKSNTNEFLDFFQSFPSPPPKKKYPKTIITYVSLSLILTLSNKAPILYLMSRLSLISTERAPSAKEHKAFHWTLVNSITKIRNLLNFKQINISTVFKFSCLVKWSSLFNLF